MTAFYKLSFITRYRFFPESLCAFLLLLFILTKSKKKSAQHHRGLLWQVELALIQSPHFPLTGGGALKTSFSALFKARFKWVPVSLVSCDRPCSVSLGCTPKSGQPKMGICALLIGCLPKMFSRFLRERGVSEKCVSDSSGKGVCPRKWAPDSFWKGVSHKKVSLIPSGKGHLPKMDPCALARGLCSIPLECTPKTG
jgi:hypothetical protein